MLVMASLSEDVYKYSCDILVWRMSLNIVVECQNKHVSHDILVWKMSLHIVEEYQSNHVSRDILVWRMSVHIKNSSCGVSK